MTRDVAGGERALRAYLNKYVGSTSVPELLDEDCTQISDAITDLLHLARKHEAEATPEQVLETALANFVAEEEEQAGDSVIESAGEITVERILIYDSEKGTGDDESQTGN